MYKNIILCTAIILGLLFLIPSRAANAGSCGYPRCWGAVGFGPYGASAFSHSYSSQYQARRRVNIECGGNCTVIKAFYNSCGAIAAGSDDGWGWGYAPSGRGAKLLALRYCRRNSYNCSIRAWSCSK